MTFPYDKPEYDPFYTLQTDKMYLKSVSMVNTRHAHSKNKLED